MADFEDDVALDLVFTVSLSLLRQIPLQVVDYISYPLAKEPQRPPSPDPTWAVFTRNPETEQRKTATEGKIASGESWSEVQIRLVGAHPLWGHYLSVFAVVQCSNWRGADSMPSVGYPQMERCSRFCVIS